METRTQVFTRHVQDYLRKTGATLPAFADEVAQEYAKRVPPQLRTMTFVYSGDAFRRLKNNAQNLGRCFDGTCRLPADLEEAVLFALPQEYMEALRAELSARVGLLAVPQVAGDTLADRAQFAGRLARESGEALKAISELLSQDEAGPQDEHRLMAADKELADLEALTAGIRETIKQHRARAATAITAMRRAG